MFNTSSIIHWLSLRCAPYPCGEALVRLVRDLLTRSVVSAVAVRSCEHLHRWVGWNLIYLGYGKPMETQTRPDFNVATSEAQTNIYIWTWANDCWSNISYDIIWSGQVCFAQLRFSKLFSEPTHRMQRKKHSTPEPNLEFTFQMWDLWDWKLTQAATKRVTSNLKRPPEMKYQHSTINQ